MITPSERKEKIKLLLSKKTLLERLPVALRKDVIVAYNMFFTPSYEHHKEIADYFKTEKDSWWKKQHGWSYLEQAGAYPQEIEFLTRNLLPHVGKDSICADIACSDGYFAHFLSPHVKQIDAFDISPLAIDFAKELTTQLGLSNINFESADATEYNFRTQYDAILMLGLTTCILEDEIIEKIALNVRASLKNSSSKLVIKDVVALPTIGNDKAQSLYGIYPPAESIYYTNYTNIYRSQEHFLSFFEKSGYIVESIALLNKKIDNKNHDNCVLPKVALTAMLRKG